MSDSGARGLRTLSGGTQHHGVRACPDYLLSVSQLDSEGAAGAVQWYVLNGQYNSMSLLRDFDF